jgi:hypothetical protein
VVYNDEYDMYARHPESGDTHRTVCHSPYGIDRDDDAYGFCEVHVAAVKGSGRCSDPGSAPIGGSCGAAGAVPGVFAFVPNVRKWGKALLLGVVTWTAGAIQHKARDGLPSTNEIGCHVRARKPMSMCLVFIHLNVGNTVCQTLS